MLEASFEYLIVRIPIYLPQFPYQSGSNHIVDDEAVKSVRPSMDDTRNDEEARCYRPTTPSSQEI